MSVAYAGDRFPPGEFYCVGGTLGSALPGIAWQAAGWPAVVSLCAASVCLGLVANAALCWRAALRRP